MAAGGMLERFLSRLRNIVLRPKQEWLVIKEEETSYRRLLAGHVAAIAAIPPIAAVIRQLVFERGIAGRSPIGYVLASNIMWYAVILVNVILTGFIISGIAGKNESLVSVRGLKLAIYSFTPAFLVSLLIVISKLNWFFYGALVYSVYLLYLGISSLMEIDRPARSAGYAVASFLAAGLVLGVFNTFEYMLESFLANRTFF